MLVTLGKSVWPLGRFDPEELILIAPEWTLQFPFLNLLAALTGSHSRSIITDLLHPVQWKNKVFPMFVIATTAGAILGPFIWRSIHKYILEPGSSQTVTISTQTDEMVEVRGAKTISTQTDEMVEVREAKTISTQTEDKVEVREVKTISTQTDEMVEVKRAKTISTETEDMVQVREAKTISTQTEDMVQVREAKTISTQTEDMVQVREAKTISTQTDDMVEVRNTETAGTQTDNANTPEVTTQTDGNNTPILYDGQFAPDKTVLKGYLNGSSIAVKRIVIKSSDAELNIFKERFETLIKFTEKEGGHNLVKYFAFEIAKHIDGNSLLAAVELCHSNLDNYIDYQNTGKFGITSKQVMMHIAIGIDYLHKHKMAHGNLKPTNVLFQQYHTGCYMVKLADFGMSSMKQPCINLSTSTNWLAPEMKRKLTDSPRISRAPISAACMDEKSDIFTMGLIFYYIETGGCLAFANQSYIQKNKKSYGHLSLSRRIMRQLLEQMNSSEPSKRPTAVEVVKHPALWRTRKVLKFFSIVAELLEKGEIPCRGLEQGRMRAIGGNWRSEVTPEMYEALKLEKIEKGPENNWFMQYLTGKHNKKASTGSIQSLLQAIWNTSDHYYDLSDESRKAIGDHPGAFTEYWLASFPDLLDHVHQAMKTYSNHPKLEHFY